MLGHGRPGGVAVARNGPGKTIWARESGGTDAVAGGDLGATRGPPGALSGPTHIEERSVRAPPPTGYIEIERVLRLLELGESDLWIAGKLQGVEHPIAAEAALLLRRGRRRQAQALLETTLLRLAGAANGNGLNWFRNTSR